MPTTMWVLVLSGICQLALGREVKLAIRPQKVSAERGKYSLLPPAASLTDGDAVPVYEKAIKALPPDTDLGQIHDWLERPVAQLPQTLAEITEVPVPKDPLSGAAFRYTRTGATAVLESATPPGNDAKDVARYEISVKN